ncbi:MAG: MFS transporter [Phycisphaeraceae bacterium]|nr:MFS transporter [Phycisphaeraceae bacterium]
MEEQPAQPAGERSPQPHSRWGVLRHRHYRNVWIGSFGSSVGGLMEFVGITWIINIVATQPAVWLGWHAAAQLGPMMILGMAGGVMADRVNRRTLLLVTQGIMMVIAAVLAVITFFGLPSLTTLMIITALLGATMAFNIPAWQVLTPRLVPREELTEAIVLNGLQFNMARVLGPALGGVLLGLFGPAILFAVNTLSFIGVMAAVRSTPDSPAPERKEAVPISRQVVEALAFVYHERGARAAFLAMTVFGMAASPLQRFLPQYVSEVYFTRELPKHQQEFAYGFLLAVMGLGAVSGAFIMRALPKWYPKHHLIPLSILCSGVAMGLFGVATNAWVGLVFLFISGIGWLISFNATFAAMQLLVPDAVRGRVLAVCNTAIFGVMAVGPVLTGMLGDYIGGKTDPGRGIQYGVAGSGALLAVAGVVMLIWRTPEVDGLKPGEAGYDRRPSLIAGITAASHRPGRG